MTSALSCPHCALALHPKRFGTKSAWMCPSCSSTAFNLSVLREEIEPATVAQFWLLAQKAKLGEVRCPSCRRAQRSIEHEAVSASIEVDVCVPCQLIWLDRGELEQLPPSTRRVSRPSAMTPQPETPGFDRALRRLSASRQAAAEARSGKSLIDDILNIIFTTFT